MAAPARYFYESPGNSLLSQNFNGEWNLVKARMEPAQFPATYINVAQMQTTVDPGEVGSESLATDLTGEIRRLYKLIKEIKGTAQTYKSPSFSIEDTIYPVGTILQHYDFNGTVNAVASGHWAYCDGSVVNNSASPLNGLTLPDLSGRYIVGAGTDGGSDLDTATWNATVVGISSPTTTFSHTHTDSGHVHTQGHTHESGTLQFQVAQTSPFKTRDLYFYDSGGSNVAVVGTVGGGSLVAGSALIQPNPNDVNFYSRTFYTRNEPGTSDGTATSTGSTGIAPSTTLGSVDIQPRSIRVRHIIRIK